MKPDVRRTVIDCNCPLSGDKQGLDHVDDATHICIVLLRRRFTVSGNEPNVRQPVQINPQE